MPLRIEDYALIGDCQTAALVARDGSIDWLCLPRFDSGTCFAALLGTPEHGRWLIAPVGGVRRVNRRYRPGTLVLETVFETEDGEVAVIDFMPPRSPRLWVQTDLELSPRSLRASSRALRSRLTLAWVRSSVANRDDRLGTLSGRERPRIGTSSARMDSVKCFAR